MNACFGEAEVELISGQIRSRFSSHVGELNDDFCAPYRQFAGQLCEGLEVCAGFVAQSARHEDDLAVIADNWRAMGKSCDQSLVLLQNLREKHPNCGAEYYMDRVLDLKSRCQRLCEMHS